MAEYLPEIAEKVKSGEYFRDARKWYDVRYHLPIADRSWLIVYTCICVLSILLAVFAFNAYLPINPRFSFSMAMPDTTDKQVYIDRIAHDRYEPKNEALARFLLQDYVKVREDYSPEKIDFQFARIKAHSSKEAFRQFYDYVSPTNPQSPLVQYQKTAKRSIALLTTEISKSVTDPTEWSARVIFDAYVIREGSQEPSRWIANITFRFQEIVVNEETGEFSPLVFEVTQYNVEPFRSR